MQTQIIISLIYIKNADLQINPICISRFRDCPIMSTRGDVVGERCTGIAFLGLLTEGKYNGVNDYLAYRIKSITRERCGYRFKHAVCNEGMG